MSNDEAKFILSAYRPGGRDADDPAMAQALAQARSDPALGAWFAREQAHDAAMTAKLREVAPPAGLREAILAGGRVSDAGGEGAAKQAAGGLPVAKRAWWAQPGWLAAAAAVALFIGLTAWRMSPVRGGTLEEFAVNFVDKGFRLPKHSDDVGVLKAWLAEQHGPLPEALPAKFADLRALGCKKLDFQGHEVSLVCFERGGKEFHVFVARREDLGRGTSAADVNLRFIPGATLVAATWMDAKHRYVVVSDADMATLKGVL
ncbi:MAG: hypothetical protein NTV51_07805 [Verrucomicrobia bacterium]|nr:hypothetical protein [Verrucomicrobiota bacterium]